METYKYQLQPYRKSSDRHVCPSCGKKGCFTYYIDTETGKPLHPSVGRCDRENECGYHYPPSEYFREHPEEKPKDDWRPMPQQPKEEKAVQYLPTSFLILDKQRERNNLYRFLSKEFGTDEANRVFSAYQVGTSKHWRNAEGLAATFPQIDEQGRLHQIKVMAYNPTTGKRLKKQDYSELWIEKRNGYVPDARNIDKIWFAGKQLVHNENAMLRQTFFGCHLIANSDRIGIVESEKTALICSILLPDIIWLATGGCNGCKWTDSDVFSPLIGKRVVLYPDAGMFKKWTEKAEILRNGGVDVTVSKVCEGMPGNTDIADVLLQERKPLEKPTTIGDVCKWMAELGIPKGRITINV